MRVLFLRKVCPVVRHVPITRNIHPLCVIRWVHIEVPATENVENGIIAPRKRGRPRKIKTEGDTVGTGDVKQLSSNLNTEVTLSLKPKKPHKAPKITDITRLIPPSAIAPSPPRPLRPYQEECVDACLGAIAKGKRRLGISLATGAGKTVIFTNLIGKVHLEDPKRYQTLILVHRRELVEQAARHCVEAYPDKV